ncbi:HpcH/HpaI aldolase/citrate lyase family protein [Nocardioides zeae]|uniref:CoA ester lyase n=1 Tax=Nocardioides zeae TaxID=1457234 RepID=A0A6P0HH78_9ACTN|nr:CoA ester lyase [Nocardioides zeae]NEN77634.1 CoA ester lyase [Nocardioides zeae]
MVPVSSPVLTPPRRVALCVPAVRPRVVEKALAAGADEVVVDLEDAVAVDDKVAARAALGDIDLAGGPAVRIAVRVNGIDTPWFVRDLEAAVALADRCHRTRPGAAPLTVVLPKTESRADLAAVERVLDALEAERGGGAPPLGVQALVETAAGLHRVDEIVADVRRVVAVVIGYADLAGSLGRGEGWSAGGWTVAAERVLWAARAAGLDAVDGPWLSVADDAAFGEAARGAAARGFDAKWVIHPRQVGTARTALAPSAAAVQHARRVLDTLAAAADEGSGAVQLDGRLLDAAMAVDARRVLRRAGEDVR